MIVTLEKMAKLLIGVGYHPSQVARALAAEYPSASSRRRECAVAEAIAQRDRCSEDLDAELESEAARALAAEHDLTKSIHGGNA